MIKLLTFVYLMTVSIPTYAKTLKVSWDYVHKKCQNFTEEKRNKHEVLCDKAQNMQDLKNKDYFPFLSTRINSGYSFTNLDVTNKANDRQTNLSTRYHFKLNPQLVSHLSENFKLYAGINFQQLEFDNKQSIPLNNPSLSLFGGEIGFIYNPWKTGSLYFSYHYGELFYLRVKNASQLQLDSHTASSFQLKFAQDVFSYGKTDFGVLGNFGFTPGFNAKNRQEQLGNYIVKDNFNYGVELYTRKHFDLISLSGGIGYNYIERDTQGFNQELSEKYFSLKVAIPLGWNE